METTILSRAALGSTAFLGDLYDARQDDFCEVNIFQTAIPPAAIRTQDSDYADIHFVHSDNFSEKFSKMDVSAELQVSLLSSTFKLSGSGRYLSDTKNSARTLKSSLIYNIKTKDENVNIYHKDLKEAFSLDAIKNDMATHVVVGISWGANSVVTCIYQNQNTENRDFKKIEGKLSGQLKKLSHALSGKANINKNDKASDLSFDVRMYADVLPQNEDLPTTFEGALEFMKKLPTLVATRNEGKGKPITFKLLPIAVIKKYLNIGLDHVETFKLNEASLLRVVHLFDEISAAQQQLNDFYQDTQEYSMYLPGDKLDEIRTFKNNMTILESSFRTKLRNHLLALRLGTEDVSKLDATIQDLYSSELASSNVFKKLESWNHMSRHIDFIRVLIKEGVNLVGKNENLDDKLLEIGDNTIYALFFTTSARSNAPEEWQRHTHLFLKTVRTKTKNTLYYAIDLDFNVMGKPEKPNIYVQVFHDGKCVETDLFGEKIGFNGDIPTQLFWMPESSSNTQKGVHPFAVKAGFDKSGNPTYVCRTPILNGGDLHVVPGNLVVAETNMITHIPLNGCKTVDLFEVLICPTWAYSWQRFTGTIPDNAILGGYNCSYCNTYIGRATLKRGVVVGKIVNGILSFCYANKEYKWKTGFEVLVRSPLGM